MHSLYQVTALFLTISLAACQSSVRMTALDRALVKKTVTPQSDGGLQIQMEGSFLANPTAAVETFHTLVEQKMGSRPYRYEYVLDKKQLTRTRSVPGAASTSTSSSVMPMVYGSLAGSGASFGEAALISASIALVAELIDLATKETPVAASVPTSDEGNSTITETVQTRILQISGKATPIAPVTLDRSKIVEVLIPKSQAAIGKLKPQVARGIADSIRTSFEKLGMQTLVSETPKQQGYAVRCAVLRAQGTYITYSNVTVEVSLHDQRTGRELTRMLVQVAEKPFDLKAQSERQSIGVATSILTKELDEKLKVYVK